jgi:predicted mannosyl-3-phosphoglycerate phosphatase (HAD superfamily)
MLHTVLATSVRSMERPSMIVLADTALFQEHATYSRHSAEPAVKTLVSHGVPVVLVSDAGASRVRSLQAAFGLRAPFIGAQGAELHVPGGHFEEIWGSDRDRTTGT